MRMVTLEGAPGPGGQPLFVEFVNTLHWYDGAPIELIGSEADFAAWLAEHGLPADDLAGGLPSVHVFREHVRGITEALAARRPPLDADLTALDAALRAPLGHLALVGADTPRSQLAFGTDAADLDLFTFQVALSLATFLGSTQRHRLKLCANPDCGFAFVDTSTNATRRWCYMRYCGNRFKARAFRRRTRQASGRGPVGGTP
jgi:predicted RNA-binding Zn ribbon-like protein